MGARRNIGELETAMREKTLVDGMPQDKQPLPRSPECVVQLRCASLPSVFGLIADHYWFVLFEDTGACHRWEVWQTSDAGGRSVGHVHCDLKDPDDDVGGGSTRIAAEWRDAQAHRLRDVLKRPEAYPHCHWYRYWPGPNSNTFAAWVLREAGVEYPLGRRAIGRKFLGR
ncbi:MAG TPA: DUF3750 domain-containing protein [Burkholderiales bacterium]|nr:DUF3750 domain-containing protein [Burkholderiales bacterium]